METIEHFMSELFHARAEEERRVVISRNVYREKFFTRECRWDSHDGVLEMIESEHIITVENTGAEAVVITEFKPFAFSKAAGERRYRYHLKGRGRSWLIFQVEMSCPACLGQGDEACIVCHGTHWYS